MAKYRNKYRIESARLQGWDYRNAGMYFITICTHNKIPYFGKCENGKLKLSAAGLLVQGCWYEIPRRNHHVQLGEFIVMPNHVHGVLILEETLPDIDSVETFNSNVSTQNASAQNIPQRSKNEYFQNISPKSSSVSRIVQQFKRACTYHIKTSLLKKDFRWQERFYDHIIRTDESFVRISNYIVNNSSKWKEDKFYIATP